MVLIGPICVNLNSEGIAYLHGHRPSPTSCTYLVGTILEVAKSQSSLDFDAIM